MNFNEVLELHSTIAAFCSKNLPDRPKLSIYDMQNNDQGYILCIRMGSTGDSFLDFLKVTARERKLEMRTFRNYFVLHSFGGLSLHEY